MRAIQVASFGGPEVLSAVEIPDPVPGPGQVVIGMAVADILFLDTLLRGGLGPGYFRRELPYVPGSGGAGEVLEVGAGVDPAWLGRRVVGRTATGYAERVVAGVDDISPVPHGLATELGITAVDAVAEGGRFVTFGSAGGFARPDPELAAGRGFRVTAPLLDGPPAAETMRELLSVALELAAEGRLRPAIGATYLASRDTPER